LLPIEWSGRIGPFRGVILSVGIQLLIVLCHTAGLAALLLPQGAAAFGLRPPAGRAAKPPGAEVDA